jgi:predicted DNA-binding antitoxin AbrB/MazE fold protein
VIHDIHAIYDQGVFRPVEPLALPEGARVRLRVEEENGSLADHNSHEYDDSDWTPEEIRPLADRWLSDPEGWGAPGMEIYDELYGEKPTDHGENS